MAPKMAAMAMGPAAAAGMPAMQMMGPAPGPAMPGGCAHLFMRSLRAYAQCLPADMQPLHLPCCSQDACGWGARPTAQMATFTNATTLTLSGLANSTSWVKFPAGAEGWRPSQW